MAVAFDLRHPDLAAQELREANEQLAREPTVSGAVRELIDAVADGLVAFEVGDFEDDPYLLIAIDRAGLQAKRALDLDDDAQQRRAARLALDQLERLMVLLAEREPSSADDDPNQIARWLLGALGLSARQLAPAVGVHERTFQRWASEPPDSTPSGEEERMLRSVAQIAGQLRHVLTGPGVLAWLTRPNDELDGETPARRLEDPAALPGVLAAARATRAVPFV
jgi:DNA-binding transcriptional regulator YiaG